MTIPEVRNLFEPAVSHREIHLRDALLAELRDFRITLRLYGIEVLYGVLPVVSADPERVARFYRTAIGRIVQFSRDAQPVVFVEAMPRESGIDVVISARKGEKERMLIVGHFPHFWFERA